MRPEDIEAIISEAEWEQIGEGAYNTVYKSKTELDIGGHKQYWVKKVPKESMDRLSAATRAVRKWNIIHTGGKDTAYLAMHNVWIAPYFGADAAPSEAIAAEVLRLYHDTRQLILDACTSGNFLRRTDGAGGVEVKCIDVDYARKRRGSTISDDPNHWASEFELECYYNNCLLTAPDKQPIISLLRTLIHIEKYLKPEEIKNEYLTPDMMSRVGIFCIYKIPLTVEIMEKLLSLSGDELTAYYKKSIYLHFMEVAEIHLTDENGEPPADTALTELETHVKRLKFPSLRVSGMEVCDGFIEGFLDKVPLIKLPVFVSKAHYLQSKGKLKEEDLPILLELLKLDEENEVPDDYLAEFIDKHKENVPFIVLAAEFCFFNLIYRITTIDPRRLFFRDQYDRTLLIIAAASERVLGPRPEVIEYLIQKKIPINHQVNCSDMPLHHGCTALDYAYRVGDYSSVDVLCDQWAKTREQLSNPAYISMHSFFVSSTVSPTAGGAGAGAGAGAGVAAAGAGGAAGPAGGGMAPTLGSG